MLKATVAATRLMPAVYNTIQKDIFGALCTMITKA